MPPQERQAATCRVKKAAGKEVLGHHGAHAHGPRVGPGARAGARGRSRYGSLVGASWDEIIEKLNKDRALLKKFTKVYPDGFTGENITDAIAEFEKTLLTPDSKFDQYLKGNEKVLTETEVEGYELFKENKCATCHTGQAMGGQSFEHISVYRDYFADRAMKADREIIRLKDQGRFNATGDEMDRGMFKTPILRNISLTAPYFHDGTVLTLEEAVEKMFIYELGKKPQKEDVDRIVEFLKTV